MSIAAMKPADCHRMTWSSTRGHSSLRSCSASESKTSASSAPLAHASAIPLTMRFRKNTQNNSAGCPSGTNASSAISTIMHTAAAITSGRRPI